MDKEGAIKKLKELNVPIIQKPGGRAWRDGEGAHYDADEVLCDLLISLGYQDVVDEWNKVEKW